MIVSSISLALYGLVVLVYQYAGGDVTAQSTRFWVHTALTAATMWAIGPIAGFLIRRSLARAYRTVELPDSIPLVDEALK